MSDEAQSFMENPKSTQHYCITSHKGIETIDLQLNDETLGWHSLGVFDLKAGKNSIELNDKGTDENQLIYADAVKWVRQQ